MILMVSHLFIVFGFLLLCGEEIKGLFLVDWNDYFMLIQPNRYKFGGIYGDTYKSAGY